MTLPRFALVLCGLLALPSFADDEMYRDPASKETLFIAGGPNVSYASLKRKSLRPLNIVSHDDKAGVIRVKFDRSDTVWALTFDADHTRIVCEAPGEPRQVFERVAIERDPLVQTATGEQTIAVTSPREEQSIYEPATDFVGTVGPDAVSIEATSFDASGAIQAKSRIKSFKPGARTFKYRVAKSLANMSLGSNRFRFVAEFKNGAVASTELRVSFHEYEGEMAKPVIYLYPTSPQQVRVTVAPRGGVTVSEPPYRDGWTVKATPEGTMLTADGRTHPYLFWESGLTERPAPLREGEVVPRSEVGAFLTERLRALGLSTAETEDFTAYWLPLMTTSPFVAVRFATRAEIDQAAPLDITPRPDTVIRVLMDFRALDAPVKLPPQKLEAAPARKGFVAVEWGGLKYRERARQ
ncbi:MAG: hypothetical protein GQE15_25970 [Archangiaceae bacterium]|nr:hypothetical protein [Archangiaceae bacterium]